MTVAIQLPPDVAVALSARWDDVPRRSLEAILAEGYRSGALSEDQVARALELGNPVDVRALLASHDEPLRKVASASPARLWRGFLRGIDTAVPRG